VGFADRGFERLQRGGRLVHPQLQQPEHVSELRLYGTVGTGLASARDHPLFLPEGGANFAKLREDGAERMLGTEGGFGRTQAVALENRRNGLIRGEGRLVLAAVEIHRSQVRKEIEVPQVVLRPRQAHGGNGLFLLLNRQVLGAAPRIQNRSLRVQTFRTGQK